MEKEYGEKDQEKMIFMKESILMIKNLVMVHLLGLQEMYLRVVILMIFAMDMEKCIGLMALTIKVLLFLFQINKNTFCRILGERNLTWRRRDENEREKTKKGNISK